MPFMGQDLYETDSSTSHLNSDRNPLLKQRDVEIV